MLQEIKCSECGKKFMVGDNHGSNTKLTCSIQCRKERKQRLAKGIRYVTSRRQRAGKLRTTKTFSGFYVYGWYVVGECLPFYVGMGSGDRFKAFHEAPAGYRTHAQKIKSLLGRSKFEVRSYRDSLTRQDAVLLESTLIELFNSMGALLTNTKVAKRQKVVLIESSIQLDKLDKKNKESTKQVWTTLQFEGFHYWPGAANHQHYGFLAQRHRHIFHVKVTWIVNCSDREIEFITQKRKVKEVIKLTQLGEILSADSGIPSDIETWSCEHWCCHLLNCFPTACEVTVSEDLENGATVHKV